MGVGQPGGAEKCRRRPRPAFLLLLPLLAAAAEAVVVGSGPFEGMISRADAVVTARVAWIDPDPPFETIVFGVDVIEVLSSTDSEVPDSFVADDVAFPLWPKDFAVPYREGESVILVLSRWSGSLNVDNHTHAILPLAPDNVTRPDMGTAAGLEARLICELLAFVGYAADDMARAKALYLASRLAEPEMAGVFERYTEVRDEWLRRAARAALLRLRPTPEVMAAVAEDFRAQLQLADRDKGRDYRFWSFYEDLYWVSRPDEYRNRPGVPERTLAYRPLYRLLIDQTTIDNGRAHKAVEALGLVGEDEDVPRVARYLDHENDPLRHETLEALAQLLGSDIPKRPGIPAYTEVLPRIIVVWEEKARAIVLEDLAAWDEAH